MIGPIPRQEPEQSQWFDAVARQIIIDMDLANASVEERNEFLDALAAHIRDVVAMTLDVAIVSEGLP